MWCQQQIDRPRHTAGDEFPLGFGFDIARQQDAHTRSTDQQHAGAIVVSASSANLRPDAGFQNAHHPSPSSGPPAQGSLLATFGRRTGNMHLRIALDHAPRAAAMIGIRMRDQQPVKLPHAQCLQDRYDDALAGIPVAEQRSGVVEQRMTRGLAPAPPAPARHPAPRFASHPRSQLAWHRPAVRAAAAARDRAPARDGATETRPPRHREHQRHHARCRQVPDCKGQSGTPG